MCAVFYHVVFFPIVHQRREGGPVCVWAATLPPAPSSEGKNGMKVYPGRGREYLPLGKHTVLAGETGGASLRRMEKQRE